MHESSYPSSKYPSEPSTASSQETMEMSVGQSVRNRSESQEIIDVDEIEELTREVEHRGECQTLDRRTTQEAHKPANSPTKWPCEGVLVIFPEGANHHVSYPFCYDSPSRAPEIPAE